ncbi:MAG: hypothetical protein ACO1QR_08870 [Chthoniobacteraceae bacterium]
MSLIATLAIRTLAIDWGYDLSAIGGLELIEHADGKLAPWGVSSVMSPVGQKHRAAQWKDYGSCRTAATVWMAPDFEGPAAGNVESALPVMGEYPDTRAPRSELGSTP